MNAPADLAKASLEDKYTVERGRVFLTGTQALIRLALMQSARQSKVVRYRASPVLSDFALVECLAPDCS